LTASHQLGATGQGLSVPVLGGKPRPGLYTDCGVSRIGDGKACGRACQFIQPDYPALERSVHGRETVPDMAEERFFAVTQAILRARLTPPAPGAQWTGITTALAARLLETGAVDAVLTVVPDPQDRWKTPPVIGIPCQVYALRALEADLGFDSITVIGTPCSDNTTTAQFHHFLSLLDDRPATISYLDFRADYRVELRFDDGRPTRVAPFLKLLISKLLADFFPMTCKTCVDYTNRLADITVGYMGGDGDQWVIVRNVRGAEILRLPDDRLTTGPLTDNGRRAGAVKGFMANTARGGRAVAAVDAGLGAAHRGLLAAADRAARAGVRPRPGRDEGNRDRAAPAPGLSRPDQEHGARSCLAADQAERLVASR
jgi:coenzyme F420 hydrogenase subunit beta